MNFKNMKIKVENNLDEIARELERLGYIKPNEDGDNIFTSQLGNTVNVFDDSMMFDCYKEATLAELKECDCESE